MNSRSYPWKQKKIERTVSALVSLPILVSKFSKSSPRSPFSRASRSYPIGPPTISNLSSPTCLSSVPKLNSREAKIATNDSNAVTEGKELAKYQVGIEAVVVPGGVQEEGETRACWRNMDKVQSSVDFV